MSAAAPALHRTVLRLHRTALACWALFVTAVLGGLGWLGGVSAPHIRHLEATCAPSDLCNIPYVGWVYGERLDNVASVIGYGFLAVAAYAGGALIGREMETGTAQLAWTQGVTPARWLAAKLAVPALALTAGDGVLVAAFRWAWSPHRDLRPGDDWSFGGIFLARGPATPAYALCALAVGALTALLLRRALPALAVSLGATGLLHLVLARVRPYLWPRLTRTEPHAYELDDSAWQVAQGRTAGGGYRATYHPPSHFWPLHLMETGIVLAAAALATAAAFALVRRRTA
ncbi:hypothetical protein [Streptomyces sp. NRRL B-3648]|uniref:hypothetical protein n=1 Tax=Streptomyces sp. NRRL B-3648 TaxID=1519493 RepID=UPI0006AF5444|nr:hypothetical protein [Streptomyces sp. NRRL B-3648]KOV95029.1 hypothetical protein ADL04_22085 [Streptomyces sp. NRRL B-3648]